MIRLYHDVPAELRNSAAEDVARAAIQTGLVFHIRKPDTLSGLLRRLIVCLGAALALTIFLSIAISRTRAPMPTPQIAYSLLPGSALPEAASCDSGDAGFRYLSFCTALQEGGGLVDFVYDRRIQVISSTSFAVDGVTIGDLILTWGNPSGYRHAYGRIQVFWDEKSAWLAAPLHPTSPVSLLVYRLDISQLPQEQLAWRGFVTVDKPAQWP